MRSLKTRPFTAMAFRRNGERPAGKMRRTLLFVGGLVVFAGTVATAGGSAGASVTKSVHPASSVAGPRLAKGPAIPLGTHPKIKGYDVVSSSYDAPNGIQSAGTASCPSGTVVYGGGEIVDSDSLDANVNSSYPLGDTEWVADVNNASGADTGFAVYAVCADKVKGYRIAEGATVDDPSNDESTATVNCPSGTVVLGGGGYSSSASTYVSVNDTYPNAGPPGSTANFTEWIFENNNLSASDASTTAYAVCAKKPKGYVFEATQPPIVSTPGTELLATATCPGSSPLPLGGGSATSFILANNTGVDMNSSFPDGSGWESYENNSSAIDYDLWTYMICVSG